MSDYQPRHIIMESDYIAFGKVFEVLDMKEDSRIVCMCTLRYDAGKIAGLLNCEQEKQLRGV